MPKVKKNSAPASATSANVGYEAQLWQMADALRGSMDAAEYKHVCLGLLFLKQGPEGRLHLLGGALALRCDLIGLLGDRLPHLGDRARVLGADHLRTIVKMARNGVLDPALQLCDRGPRLLPARLGLGMQPIGELRLNGREAFGRHLRRPV